MKHTPGKWIQSHRQIPYNEDGYYATQVYTEDGETIATLSWCSMPKVVEKFEGRDVVVTRSYREANAKLIAASPDLLEACLCMIKAFDDAPKEWLMTSDVMNAESVMKEAINKAIS